MRSSTFIARVHYSCTSVYLISWTVYLRILRTRHYDVMVGCWFTGQGKKGDCVGKKGDCVGKKVNDGPVVARINVELDRLTSRGSCALATAWSFHRLGL